MGVGVGQYVYHELCYQSIMEDWDHSLEGSGKPDCEEQTDQCVALKEGQSAGLQLADECSIEGRTHRRQDNVRQ